MRKKLFLSMLCALSSWSMFAGGLMPLDGDWKLAFRNGIKALEFDGNTIVGLQFAETPAQHSTYAVEKKLDVPVNGDFTAEVMLNFDIQDGNFIGNALLQLIDDKNQVLAQSGLRDHWVGAGAIIFAQTEKTQTNQRVALPYNGKLAVRIDRAGDRCTIYGNGVKIMEHQIGAAPVVKVRLFFDTYIGGDGHFGKFEFSDPTVGARKNEVPTVGVKTFEDKPRNSFDPEWITASIIGAKKMLLEGTDDGLQINGFEQGIAGAKNYTYTLERRLGALNGDFTAVLEMAWKSPSNGMGEVFLQMFDDKGVLVAEAGLVDGWISGSPRSAGWVGPGRKGAAFWLPHEGDEQFIITRKGDRVTVHCGHWKLEDKEVDPNVTVASAKLIIRQHLAYDKDNTTILSSFGTFRIKRLAVTDEALPIPAPRVAPIDRTGNWEIGKPIVTFWAGPAISEEMAAQLAEGGWNLAWGVTVSDLDIMHKHGLRGIMWVTVAVNPENEQRLKWWLDSFRDHPAAYAVHCGDEPGGAKMDACARGVAFFEREAPELMHYNNMFPINASNKQLGHNGTAVEAYKAHIEEYFQKLKPQLLSYDKYHFCYNGDDGAYFINQALIRDAALRYNVPSMNILQACSWAPTLRVPNGNEYRFLVYTSMAYGSQGISNYVYGHPGHWGCAYDPETKQTGPLYDAMKSINREFVAIASELQSVKSLAVWHAGEIPFGVDAMPENAAFQLNPKWENYSQGLEDAKIHYAQGNNFFNSRPPLKGFLLGCFGKEGKASHILVVNMDYKKSAVTTFSAPAALERFDQTTGTWSAVGDSKVKLEIAPGSGVLLRFADNVKVDLLANGAKQPIVKIGPPRDTISASAAAGAYVEDFTGSAKADAWSCNYTKGCSGINITPSQEGLVINGLKNASGAEDQAILARSFTPVEGDFICSIEYEQVPNASAAGNNVEFKLQVGNGETLISASIIGNRDLRGHVGWNGKVLSIRPKGFDMKYFTDKTINITRRGDTYTVSGGKLHGVLSCTGDTSPIAIMSIHFSGNNSAIVIKKITIRNLD